MMRPFVVVYGTSGTAEQTRMNLQLARLYAYQWWYRANGHLRIIPDSEFSDSWHSYNLVLLGGPECNSVTARFCGSLPIEPVDGGVRVGDRLLPGADLTYKFVYPNPLTDYRTLLLVEGGTSLEAMKRLSSVIAIYSGAGFPDWMVWGGEVELLGLGGARAAGFFDMQWEIAPDLTFFNEDLISQAW
ncbi:hypothetical protein IIA79_08725 [bacterium]|nr:hypothetical protein [bacterium]